MLNFRLKILSQPASLVEISYLNQSEQRHISTGSNVTSVQNVKNTADVHPNQLASKLNFDQETNIISFFFTFQNLSFIIYYTYYEFIFNTFRAIRPKVKISAKIRKFEANILRTVKFRLKIPSRLASLVNFLYLES